MVRLSAGGTCPATFSIVSRRQRPGTRRGARPFALAGDGEACETQWKRSLSMSQDLKTTRVLPSAKPPASVADDGRVRIGAGLGTPATRRS